MFSAPMGGTDIENDGCIGPKSRAFYEYRALGGAGAVTVSELMVHPATDGSHAFHSFYKPKCFALPYILSKYIALGMSVEDVLERATARVAKFAGWDRKGVLEPGYDADIAVLSVEKQDVAFEDFKGDAVSGHMLLLPQLTMKAGTIVYRNLSFT